MPDLALGTEGVYHTLTGLSASVAIGKGLGKRDSTDNCVYFFVVFVNFVAMEMKEVGTTLLCVNLILVCWSVFGEPMNFMRFSCETWLCLHCYGY